jgi:SH3-like domain-containing protein
MEKYAYEMSSLEADILEPPETPETPEPPEPPVYAVVTAKKLNLRELPTKSQEAKVIQILKEGDLVLVSETSGEWARVFSENGIEGYVMREFIKEE